jgi:hypothetical protein
MNPPSTLLLLSLPTSSSSRPNSTTEQISHQSKSKSHNHPKKIKWPFRSKKDHVRDVSASPSVDSQRPLIPNSLASSSSSSSSFSHENTASEHHPNHPPPSYHDTDSSDPSKQSHSNPKATTTTTLNSDDPSIDVDQERQKQQQEKERREQGRIQEKTLGSMIAAEVTFQSVLGALILG